MSTILPHDRNSEKTIAQSPAWLAMGFRPFFLCAALFACVTILMWLHALSSGTAPSAGYMPFTLWHAHEMIFGFTMAVIAGFLLTAARNWTQLNTMHGYSLLMLVLLWLFGRIAMAGLFPLPGKLIALSVVGFQLWLALAVGHVIVRAGSRRNFGIVVVLVLFTVASACAHLDALGFINNAATPAIHGALHLIIVLNVVIGGRIVPLFTRNRTGQQSIHNVINVDHAAIIAAVLVAAIATLATVFQNKTLVWTLSSVACVSGVLQLLRMRTWGSRAAMRIPMLAVLHAGYAWIGVGHLTMAAAFFIPTLSHTLALHALSIGVIGTMTLGMMARVTQGHTGRAIQASRLLVAGFVAINAAAAARLAAALLPANHLATTWMVSGTLFCVAYAAYFFSALKPLTSRRIDNRAG
ncbi:MAG: NnrS family protein [Myxococcales bacterium]|nr:MAG: NnrS family protein [Myxococcales bacterium]